MIYTILINANNGTHTHTHHPNIIKCEKRKDITKYKNDEEKLRIRTYEMLSY